MAAFVGRKKDMGGTALPPLLRKGGKKKRAYNLQAGNR